MTHIHTHTHKEGPFISGGLMTGWYFYLWVTRSVKAPDYWKSERLEVEWNCHTSFNKSNTGASRFYSRIKKINSFSMDLCTSAPVVVGGSHSREHILITHYIQLRGVLTTLWKFHVDSMIVICALLSSCCQSLWQHVNCCIDCTVHNHVTTLPVLLKFYNCSDQSWGV